MTSLLLALALCAAPPDPDDDDNAPDTSERETVVDAPLDAGYLYTADLSDEELERRFMEDLPSLGSISVGLAEAGRVINGVQLQPSAHLEVVTPENAWATEETAGFLKAIADDVATARPDAAPLRVCHIGKRDGGYLRPHFSHQSGRDVDIGFYYPHGTDIQHLSKNRIDAMDLASNWAMVKALAAKADVQVVLLDRKVQAALDRYAQAQGEDPVLLTRLFHSGAESLFQHARRHKDHFHVRFFAARAQELGRRVQPLLAKRADENMVIHRVRAGETLGAVASRYGSSVKMIQKASGLASTLLSVGRTLVVPLRGPCTQCPVAAPVVVPPRVLAAAPVEPVEAAPPTPAEDPPPAALPFELRRAGLPEP
jgi:LysM repeat protein